MHFRLTFCEPQVSEKRLEGDRERAIWKFQTDKTQDPLDEWKRLRKTGVIKNLKREGQEGGIPIPLPSFGVGGSFGQGGAYDNGERFDLRLPYADQVRPGHSVGPVSVPYL